MSLQSSQHSIGQSFTHWLQAVNKDQLRAHLVFHVLGWGECLSCSHPTWIHFVSITWALKAGHPQGVYSYMEGMQKENNYTIAVLAKEAWPRTLGRVGRSWWTLSLPLMARLNTGNKGPSFSSSCGIFLSVKVQLPHRVILVGRGKLWNKTLPTFATCCYSP